MSKTRPAVLLRDARHEHLAAPIGENGRGGPLSPVNDRFVSMRRGGSRCRAHLVPISTAGDRAGMFADWEEGIRRRLRHQLGGRVVAGVVPGGRFPATRDGCLSFRDAVVRCARHQAAIPQGGDMATIKMSSNITAEQTICPLGHESLSLDPPMILKAGSRSPRSDPRYPFQEAALTRCSRQQHQSGR